MALKSLFLSHYHKDAQEVQRLASELRLRGIVPWVDKDGGFDIGDRTEDEARRIIREDSFGVLLYATEHVFDRPFIRRVEIDEARKMMEVDPDFLLVAVPRGIGFAELRTLSKKKLGVDLSGFYTVVLPEMVDLNFGLEEVARRVLRRSLRRKASGGRKPDLLGLQVSTREVLPDEDDDVLRIDAESLFRSGVTQSSNWDRFVRGLRDVKREVTAWFGRPRLRIHGSKHLTAAFLVGRIFAPFKIDIRQGDEYWSTYGPSVDRGGLCLSVRENRSGSGILAVEIATGAKGVTPAADTFIHEHGIEPKCRIQLSPGLGPVELNGTMCRGLVKQALGQVELAVGNHRPTEVHIFAAVPQALMMMLGQGFGALPGVRLYEYDGNRYSPSLWVPSGAL